MMQHLLTVCRGARNGRGTCTKHRQATVEGHSLGIRATANYIELLQREGDRATPQQPPETFCIDAECTKQISL